MKNILSCSQRLLVVYMVSAAIFSMFPAGAAGENSANILFREEFNTIDNWRPLFFPKIKRHSSYSIESDAEGSYLKTESHASASAMIYRQTFDVYTFPNIRWRWKALNIYKNGNAEIRDGDDYPARLYIIFKYEPEKAGFFEKLKYSTAKLLYGEYPPHSAVNYIWASRDHKRRIMVNAYSEKAMMFIKRGPSDIGAWHAESANILNDYLEAFGEKPPAIASLAVMNDSDNTGEKSVSYFDFIEVYR